MFATQLYDEPIDAFSTGVSAAWDQAHCCDDTGSTTELYFSDQIPDINLAKAICEGCPVAEPCLEGAIARQEPWGVWGGHLFSDGKILAQKRKRGRPRKVEAQEDIQLTA